MTATETAGQDNVEQAIFRRIVVWFDPQASEHGSWSHALEWATRLRLPLCVLAANPIACEHVFPGATACALRGIRWDFKLCGNPPLADVSDLLEPADLFVFNQALPPVLRHEFLLRTVDQSGIAVLVCTTSPLPLTRVLMLDQLNYSGLRFLARGIKLANYLGAAPVVLTVARSERAARSRQQLIRRALGCCDLTVDIDFVVGSEVRAAVAHVARWRRSQLVVMEQQSAPGWWRWLRGNPMERLMDGLDSLAFLSLPEAGAIDSHLDPLHPALASEEATLLPASR